MNIVITGATSFIGASVLNKLLAKGNRIWVVVRPSSVNRKKIPDSDLIEVVELDMSDIDKLGKYIHETIDVFYHFAWEGVRAPLRDDASVQYRNYRTAVMAMQVCKELDVKKFIGCGSQAEYGNMCGRVDEMYPCKPLTEYGKAKLKTYKELKKYAEVQKMDFIWTRIFSVYGPEDFKGSLVMSCLDKMKKNETIQLTKCQQEWDYIYIDEVSDIFVLFAEKESESGVYNVASGKHDVLRKYVEQMKETMNSQSILKFGEIPYPKSGMVSFVPDVRKLEKSLGWKNQISFEEGIRRIIRGFEDENDKYSSANIQ